MFNAIMDVLMVSRIELILDNLTFNFNSLLGIVYVSFYVFVLCFVVYVISTGNFYLTSMWPFLIVTI
jgi:hypothetical protein